MTIVNTLTRSAGRVALITGANTGLGAATALSLAERGYFLVLAGRSFERTRPVMEDIRRRVGAGRVHHVPLDLGDPASVVACAQAFGRMGLPLHLLINNAGVAGQPGLTVTGFEPCFAINHLGHFLLTRLLLPSLLATAEAELSGRHRASSVRVVHVASRAHRLVGGIAWNRLQQPATGWRSLQAYATSKLANILFSQELQRRAGPLGISSLALHPGVLSSDLWRHQPAWLAWLMGLRGAAVEDGVPTVMHCATADLLPGSGGGYFAHRIRVRPSRAACSTALAHELWQRSEAWCGLEPWPTTLPSRPGALMPLDGHDAQGRARPASESTRLLAQRG